MSFLDTFLKAMKLNPDDEEDDDLYGYEDDYEEEQPRKKSAFRSSKKAEEEDEEENEKKVPMKPVSPKITPIRQSKQAPGAMEVCVIKPTSVEDAREVAETLLDNRPVILNVEGLDIDIAQRIIDFICGATFAIRGNLQKVSNFIFIVTPQNVDIAGDFLTLSDSFNTQGVIKVD